LKADAQSSLEREALEWAVAYFRTHGAELTGDGSRRRLIADGVAFLLKEHDKAKDGFDDYVDGVDAYLHAWENGIEAGLPDIRREFAAALLERGEPLPRRLLKFVADYLRNPETAGRKRGQNIYKLKHRNLAISFAIAQIMEKWKFEGMRNDATVGASAASIVRDALEKSASLHLTEAAVHKIWRYFGAYWRAMAPYWRAAKTPGAISRERPVGINSDD
jgi:hypothetical protein